MIFEQIYKNILNESVLFTDNTVFVPRKIKERIKLKRIQEIRKLKNVVDENGYYSDVLNISDVGYEIPVIPNFVKEVYGLKVDGNILQKIPKDLYVSGDSLNITNNTFITNLPSGKSFLSLYYITLFEAKKINYLPETLAQRDDADVLLECTLCSFDKMPSKLNGRSIVLSMCKFNDFPELIETSLETTIRGCTFTNKVLTTDFNVIYVNSDYCRFGLITSNLQEVRSNFNGKGPNLFSEILFKNNLELTKITGDLKSYNSITFISNPKLKEISGKINAAKLTIDDCPNVELESFDKNMHVNNLVLPPQLYNKWGADNIKNYFNNKSMVVVNPQ